MDVVGPYCESLGANSVNFCHGGTRGVCRDCTGVVEPDPNPHGDCVGYQLRAAPGSASGNSAEADDALVACYFRPWRGSLHREADVPSTEEGVLQCREACRASGFSYFSFECPHNRGPTGEDVHCQCSNELENVQSGPGEERDAQWCEGKEVEEHNHCVGPYKVGPWLLGDGGIASVYKV